LIPPAGASAPSLPSAIAPAKAGVAALSLPLPLTPPQVPHTTVEVDNPHVNIASVEGRCEVAIVVFHDINNVSVPREDGIANVCCHANAAATIADCCQLCTAIAVALASIITIAAAAVNVTVAIVVSTATVP
jgi:hypothetical protein